MPGLLLSFSRASPVGPGRARPWAGSELDASAEGEGVAAGLGETEGGVEIEESGQSVGKSAEAPSDRVKQSRSGSAEVMVKRSLNGPLAWRATRPPMAD